MSNPTIIFTNDNFYISFNGIGAQGAPGIGLPVGGTSGQVLAKIDSTNYNTHWVNPTAGTGTVQSVSIVSANGIAGTVANPTTTPAITLSTTVNGVLKGNGTTISAAAAGTDYVIPSGSITGTASNITATSNNALTTLSALSLPYSQITGTPATGVSSVFGRTGAVIANTGDYSVSQITGAQGAITLTTTGTSGAATFSGNTLNIPQYSGTTYSAGTGLTLTGGVFSVNAAQTQITSVGTLTSGAIGSGFTTIAVAQGGTGVTTSTGTGNNVLSNSPTLVTPVLGTPSSGNLANCTFPILNQNTTGQSGTVATINSLISAGTNVTITGSGTSASPYNISASGGGSSSFNAITSGTNTTATMTVGTGASILTSGSGTIAATSVPASGIGSGTASINISGNAATVTTNANLTGDVTSSGNATTLATVNSNIGTFNNVTVNGKGLVTAASNVSYQAPITITTTGTSGAATFISNTLNIPQYAGTPGGSNTQVQYNNSGSFGGISGATTDGTNLLVTTQPITDNSTKAASTAWVNEQQSAFTASIAYTGGTANAITISNTSPNTFNLTDGNVLTWTPAYNITTNSATLNVAGSGTFPLYKIGLAGYVPCQPGDILAGVPVVAQYNATYGLWVDLIVPFLPYESTVSTNQTLTISSGYTTYTSTAATTFTIPQSTTLVDFWFVNIYALGGAVTVTPYSTDKINGGTTGASVTIPQGNTSVVYTDANGNLYVPGITSGGTTYTAGTGLTLTAGAFSVNTSQNIATLSNLTSNGFVKTSGGTGALSVDTTAYTPTSTTVNGHALSSNVTVTASDVGLGSVTNDAQTKAAIVPNTVPTAGQHLVGNAGGTAYAPVTMSGSGATITQSSSGVVTISAIANASLSNSTISGIALGGTLGALTATNTTLTFSGSYTGASAQTVGLNLSNANTWAALQTFGTNISIGGVTATGATGTGNNVFSASPTFTGTITAATGTFSGVVTSAVGTSTGNVATIDGAQTLTNKRITQRVLALSANSATPSINTDNYDVVHITAQTAAITSFTSGLTGTPVDGDRLRISITGTTAVALTWGASFESSTATLPTTTTSTNRLDVGFFWNTESSHWRCVAVA